MYIQQIRNATLKITYAHTTLLVDPWLAPKGALGCFRDFPDEVPDVRMETIPMPMCDLPLPVKAILGGVDYYLTTHVHVDHFDVAAGGSALDKHTPMLVQNAADAAFMQGAGFEAVTTLTGEPLKLGSFSITKTPGRHGVITPCGPASGFILRAPGEKTLYVAGDTIFFDGVRATLQKYQPDVIVLNACAATLVANGRLIMDADDVIKVRACAPHATIILSHMDTVAHACLTRATLRQQLEAKQATANMLLPADGEGYSL